MGLSAVVLPSSTTDDLFDCFLLFYKFQLSWHSNPPLAAAGGGLKIHQLQARTPRRGQRAGEVLLQLLSAAL